MVMVEHEYPDYKEPRQDRKEEAPDENGQEDAAGKASRQKYEGRKDRHPATQLAFVCELACGENQFFSGSLTHRINDSKTSPD